MHYLLSRASRAILMRLAQERTLCAFDFDGTLSPIVEHPGQAVMGDQTRSLLVRLAALYPCIIVSGRGRADVLGRLRGVKVARVIGNHGAETEATIRKPERRLERWKASLELELGALPGVWVEDKGLSVARASELVLYVMYNIMRFEWDADKNQSNQKKHAGIDFETASRVFADPNLVLRKDRVVEGEQRWHGIGAVRKAVLFVVHVYREEKSNGEEVIRNISPREADPSERRIYLEQPPY